MATTIPMLRVWFENGKADFTVTHMVVKYDSFDGEDYPVYVNSDENVREVAGKGERTMEVYAMHLPFDAQASEFRSFHYEYPEEN